MGSPSIGRPGDRSSLTRTPPGARREIESSIALSLWMPPSWKIKSNGPAEENVLPASVNDLRAGVGQFSDGPLVAIRIDLNRHERRVGPIASTIAGSPPRRPFPSPRTGRQASLTPTRQAADAPRELRNHQPSLAPDPSDR